MTWRRHENGSGATPKYTTVNQNFRVRIPVSKSHKFLLKVHWLSYFFRQRRLRLHINTAYFFPRRCKDSTSTTSRCFSTTSDTTACRCVAATWFRFFPRLALVLNYIPRPLCLSKVTFPPMSPCRICFLIKYVCHHVVLVFDVDRVELF